MKVFELAKKLNVTSKEVISHAQETGIELKSHMNNLTDDQAGKIEKTFGKSGSAPKSPAKKTAESVSKAPAKKASEPEPKAVPKAAPKKPASPAAEPAKPAAETSQSASTEAPQNAAAGRRRPFIGKPRVNSDFLDNREKAVKEASEKKNEEEAKPAEAAAAHAAPPAAEQEPEEPVKAGKSEKAEPAGTASSAARAETAAKPAASPTDSGNTAPAAEKQAASEKAQTAEKTPSQEKPSATSAKAEQRPKEAPAGAKPAKTAGNEAEAQKPSAASKPSTASKPSEASPSDKPAPARKPARETSGEPHAAAQTSAKREDRPPAGLKIIRRASEDEQLKPSSSERRRPGTARTQQERGSRQGRPERGGERRPRQGSAPQRPGDSRDQRRGGTAQGRNDSRPDASRQGGRKKQNERFDHEQHNKFDKFERKSLEKQTRNKHAKYKNTAEPEPEEQIIIPEGTIVLNVPITVAGFCEQTEISTSKVIMTLMKLGIMANINQNIDEDTVSVLADELGISVHIANVDNTEEELEAEELDLEPDDEKDLKPRPPIITVMGHVDHGKTSLLDAIRKTNVTAKEFGGITQHIGASEVRVNGQKIVFLDTPGHEAFTAMRARGAHITDIAVLVVAADDGVMPQTVESISHAKAAGVPIIVAINKMDKPHANPDRVKQELADHGVIVEDYGGDVISVPVSAKTGEGISTLLEMILLQAEVLELKANPNRLASGSVIEARLDKSKGPVATLLVMNGTLQSGQSIVAGTCAGRIRLMTDYKGKTIKKAGPSTAVEVLGLTDVPQAGDDFNAVSSDKVAKEIAGKRAERMREEVMKKTSSMSLEKFFSQMKEGEVKELNLIIKGDVQGSIGAVVSSLEKLNNDEVKVNIIHSGVGAVTESDIMLAGTSGAVIIGFNVRPSSAVQAMADRDGVEIRSYTVIYDVINDVEAAMKGMLEPEYKEEVLGKAEIRNTFKVPGIGIVGGAYVTEGKIVRNGDIRLVRDGVVIHEGKIASLKRFKDDAKEVAQGYECGIGIEDYNDIKEGDVIECYHMVEVKRS